MKSNSEAVYQVMTSHGDVDALLYFADLMRGHNIVLNYYLIFCVELLFMFSDFEEVANLYVQQEHYDEALAVLKKQVLHSEMLLLIKTRFL